MMEEMDILSLDLINLKISKTDEHSVTDIGIQKGDDEQKFCDDQYQSVIDWLFQSVYFHGYWSVTAT